MGPQQILRAAAGLVVVTATAIAHAAPHFKAPPAAPAKVHERVAIVDLGPADDGAARRAIGATLAAAGLDLVIGDGLDDALAGISAAADAAPLAAAASEAKQAFGELDCAKTIVAADRAIGLAAARQAAGLAVPELPRALAYELLCADRSGDTAAAMTAAARLRVVAPAGVPEVPAAVLAKYPEVDVVADRELVDVDVDADVPGAALWVDFEPAGTAPQHLTLAVGPHVIAAAVGTRRGWIAGTAVKKQKQVTIATAEQAGAHAALAARVAGWKGAMPAPTELAAVLAEVHARAAIVRHGDVIEAWGHAGLAEPLRRLGGEDGTRTLGEVDQLVALVVDRARAWNDRSPDPDVPLLVDTPKDRAARGAAVDHPTKWWVYAVIAGAVIAGGIVLYAHDNAQDTQRVELKYP